MPYGVWIVASGKSVAVRSSRGPPSGAPADSSRRMCANASPCSPAVATTFVMAAGDRKIESASTARTAAASRSAVRVAGRVTSISGVAVRQPSAGPSSANGAKPATSPLSGPSPHSRRSASRTPPSRR